MIRGLSERGGEDDLAIAAAMADDPICRCTGLSPPQSLFRPHPLPGTLDRVASWKKPGRAIRVVIHEEEGVEHHYWRTEDGEGNISWRKEARAPHGEGLNRGRADDGRVERGARGVAAGAPPREPRSQAADAVSLAAAR